MRKPDITTVVLTLNEEKNIERCIRSALSISKEVIVLDSGSKDNTLSIARELGARCEVREFTDYSDQRNFALGLVKTEWVLFLDADEELSEELKREILYHIEMYGHYYDGFLIPRRNWYLGGFLKCWSPDRLLRLFKAKMGTWEGRVHEKVNIRGRVGYLKGAILHYPFRDLYHQYLKNLNYARLLAEEKFDKGKKFNIFDLTFRPILNFLKHYLLKGCFLEGFRGLIFSLFYFVYTVQKYSILYEKWHKRGQKA
ncbi:MAG: glycosyltransferase family 2 protein [candidate division WOR-3 bacterium]